MINKLIKLANTLEVLGYEESSGLIDKFIIKVAGKNDKNISMIDFMDNIDRLPKSELERLSFNDALSQMWNTIQTIRMISDQSWRHDIDRSIFDEISKNRDTAWAIHNLVKAMGPSKLFI